MFGKSHLVIVRRRTGWTPDSEGRGGVTTSDTTVRGRIIARSSHETRPNMVGEYGSFSLLDLFVEPRVIISDQDLVVAAAQVPDPTTGIMIQSGVDAFLWAEYEIENIEYTVDHLDVVLRRAGKQYSPGTLGTSDQI